MKELVHNISLDIKSLLNRRMLILFIALLLLYIFFNMGMAFFIVPLIFAVQPFAAEEYNQPLKKSYTEKKVAGRYIFGLILLMFTVLITTLLSIGFSLSLEDNIKLLSLRGTIGMIATYIVAMSIIYPLYFKSGFKKSNTFLYLIILVYAVIVSLNQRIPILKDIINYLEEVDLFILIPIFIVISLIFLFLSFRLSSKYDKLKK